MFARNPHLHSEPNCAVEFTQMIEEEVTPLLREQRGFPDEITFVTPNGTEIVGISLWGEKADMDRPSVASGSAESAGESS